MIKELIEELKEIRKKIDGYTDILIYGAGVNGIFAYEYIKKIRNTINVLAFVDNDEKKQNDPIYIEKYGIPCISWTDVNEYPTENVLAINAIRGKKEEVFELLKTKNIECVSAFSYIYSLQYEKLERLYNVLEGEISKKVLCNVIQGNLDENNKSYESIQEGNQYFAIPSFAYRRVDEVFVDCGAYVGDVIEHYLFQRCGTFEKIYAFEPGVKQRKAMEKRISRLKEEWALDDNKIEVGPYAIGEEGKKIQIQLNQVLSSSSLVIGNQSNCTEEVEIISLDEFFEFKEKKPTFIKVDIEGYELDMLKGTKKIIQKYAPIMAISVYHRPEDLWEIYDYVSSITDQYAYCLRHHSSCYAETILYCYPKKD